jgi:hypothetical protein
MKANEMGRACVTRGRERSILVGKPEEKKPLGRPRRRWEDNSRMDLRGIEWVAVVWIRLAQDRD